MKGKNQGVELDDLLASSGIKTKFSSKTKGLMVYFGGKSGNYRKILSAVVEAKVPPKYRKAVTCSLLNGYMNGRVNVSSGFFCRTVSEAFRVMTNPKKIPEIFGVMKMDSLDEWNKAIDVIDIYKKSK